MKTKKILFFAFSAVALLLSSCGGSSDDKDLVPTGVTLDKITASVMVEDSTTLKATIAPSGATGTVTWTTSNAAVATVREGVVKGIKEGSATITATVGTFTATCAVTVTENTDYSKSLKGSNYYVIAMDATTFTSIQSKVVADFRPDDVTKFLYVWENTYSAGTSTGPNFYGEVEAWTSLVVGSVGWSGAGFNVKDATLLDKLSDVATNPDGYYLHIGIKSKNSATHLIALDGSPITNTTTATSGKVAIGSTPFVDNGNTYAAVADFKRDGEWHEIEIPMSTFFQLGLKYVSGTNSAGANVLWFLSGGTAGTTFDIDAVFIYKKA